MRKTLIALGATALLATTAAPALALTQGSSSPLTQKTANESSSTVYQIERGNLKVVQPGGRDQFSGVFVDGTVEMTVTEGRYYTVQIDALQIDTVERIPVPVQATVTFDKKATTGSTDAKCTVLKYGEPATFAGKVYVLPGRDLTVINSNRDFLSVQLKKI